MANLPVKYRKSTEAIASFSFEDIATGLGVVQFLGTASEDDSGVDYHLITTALEANPVGTSRASQGITTLDFDSSTFNLQRTAKGTGQLTLCAIGGNPANREIRTADRAERRFTDGSQRFLSVARWKPREFSPMTRSTSSPTS